MVERGDKVATGQWSVEEAPHGGSCMQFGWFWNHSRACSVMSVFDGLLITKMW